MYVIGRTGTGKSTLLETLMRQDIAQGNGMALLDPHGDLAEKIVGAVPDTRKGDLVYFNAPDPAQPYGYT
jgi:ABC-type branched-subunit amino acid transport system ATPase component